MHQYIKTSYAPQKVYHKTHFSPQELEELLANSTSAEWYYRDILGLRTKRLGADGESLKKWQGDYEGQLHLLAGDLAVITCSSTYAKSLALRAGWTDAPYFFHPVTSQSSFVFAPLYPREDRSVTLQVGGATVTVKTAQGTPLGWEEYRNQQTGENFQRYLLAPPSDGLRWKKPLYQQIPELPLEVKDALLSEAAA